VEGEGLLWMAAVAEVCWFWVPGQQQQLSLRFRPIGTVAEGLACPSQDELDLSGLLAQLSHSLQWTVGCDQLPLRASQL